MYTNAHGLLFVLTSAVLLTVLGVLGYLFWNRAVGAALVSGIPVAVVVNPIYLGPPRNSEKIVL